MNTTSPETQMQAALRLARNELDEATHDIGVLLQAQRILDRQGILVNIIQKVTVGAQDRRVKALVELKVLLDANEIIKGKKLAAV